MSQFGRPSGCTTQQLTVSDDAATNSGSQGQADHVAISARSPSPVFSVSSGIRIVFNEGGQTKLSAKSTLQAGSRPTRQSRRRQHNTAGREVNLSNRAHP